MPTAFLGAHVAIVPSLVAETFGRTSVEAHVWTALAHRVAGDAALAAGDTITAERHFREAARIAPACWFGRRR